MHTVWMNSGMKKRQNVGVEVVKANPAGHLVFFLFIFFNKCLLKDLHQMMKRSRMRNDCADVTQWISELWRLMEILEEPGLHVLWRRGRQAGQDPKKYVGETKGRGLNVLRGIKEQISNQQMRALPSKIEDRAINNAK